MRDDAARCEYRHCWYRTRRISTGSSSDLSCGWVGQFLVECDDDPQVMALLLGHSMNGFDDAPEASNTEP